MTRPAYFARPDDRQSRGLLASLIMWSVKSWLDTA